MSTKTTSAKEQAEVRKMKEGLVKEAKGGLQQNSALAKALPSVALVRGPCKYVLVRALNQKNEARLFVHSSQGEYHKVNVPIPHTWHTQKPEKHFYGTRAHTHTKQN